MAGRGTVTTLQMWAMTMTLVMTMTTAARSALKRVR